MKKIIELRQLAKNFFLKSKRIVRKNAKFIILNNPFSQLIFVLIIIYLLDVFLIYVHANYHRNSLFSLLSLKYLSLYSQDYLILGILKNLGITFKTFLYFVASILFIRILLSIQYYVLKDVSEEEKAVLTEGTESKKKEEDTSEKNKHSKLNNWIIFFQNPRTVWQMLTIGSLVLSFGFTIHFTINGLPQFNKINYGSSLSASEIKLSQSLQAMINIELQKIEADPHIFDSKPKQDELDLKHLRQLYIISQLINIQNQIGTPTRKEWFSQYLPQIYLVQKNMNNGTDIRSLLKQFNESVKEQVGVLEKQAEYAKEGNKETEEHDRREEYNGKTR
jgi:hypothetical protein